MSMTTPEEELLVRTLRAQIKQYTDEGNLHEIIAIKAKLINMIPRGQRTGSLMDIMRRVDRANGILVRRGQFGPDKWIQAKNDNNKIPDDMYQSSLQFFTSNDDRRACYIYATVESEEEWDAILEKAHKDKSLSRSHIAALITGKEYRQGDVLRGNVGRHELMSKMHHHKPRRVIDQAVMAIEGACVGLQIIAEEDYEVLELEDLNSWVKSLNKSINQINHLRKRLNDVRKQ